MVGARSPHRRSAAPLFGGVEILEEVDRLLAAAREGQGQGLVLVGAGGSGKTHVLRAVVERGTDRKFRILSGRALPEELPPPFSLLRDLLGSMGEEETPEMAGTEAAVTLPIFLAPFGEEVAAHPRSTEEVPRTTAALDDLERILAPVGRSTVEGLGAGRDELLGRLEDYFRTLCRDRPLLIAVDDLQLADTSSLEFLQRFAIDLPGTPAIVVATVGVSAEIPERTRATLELLTGSPAFRSMPVRPLTVPEVMEFVRWILGGQTPDPQDVLRWHAQTEGNPLFIEQLVRTVSGFGSMAGRVAPTNGRDVTEILLARVRALGENERRVLTYAAVLGKEFEFLDLAAVAGLEEERVTESLDRLVQNGLLREKGDEVYEFVTEAVRASVYSDLTETRRRILHQKAGLALEAKGDARDSELARQFYLGRDNARAVKYNVAAAQSAIRAFAFETAVAHLARALEAERRRPDRDVSAEMRFLTEQGRLLTEMGSLQRSEEILSEAVEFTRAHAGHDLELGRALLALAQSRNERSEYPSAEALAAEAMPLLAKAGTKRDLMAAHRVLGSVYWRRGDIREAELHQRAALEIAEHEGTPNEKGHALVDVANTMIRAGPARLDATLELYARAAALFAEGEDHGARARVLMNRAVLEYEVGRVEDALKNIALAIDSAERSRSPIWIGYAHLNAAQWRTELGQTTLAHNLLERAVQFLTPMGDHLAEQQILMSRGMLAHAERDFDAAEANYHEALDVARRLHLASETSEMFLRLAQLSHDRGDDAEARHRLAEAVRSGILDHRPDFAPRVAALEQALSAPPNPQR
jgi:tetratricopeptide (TPR) repeat protein